MCATGGGEGDGEKLILLWAMQIKLILNGDVSQLIYFFSDL